MTRTVSEIEDALASHGISLATASAEEAQVSQRLSAFAKAVGNFAIAFAEHEIVAVDGRGQVYRLDERTTGQSPSDIAGRLAGIDRDSLLSVADTKEVMQEAARAQRSFSRLGLHHRTVRRHREPFLVGPTRLQV